MIVHGIGALMADNPGWTVRVWDDVEVEQYLQDNISPLDYELIRHTHIVEKSDLWRLLVMYYEGGYYQDIDRAYDKGPLCNDFDINLIPAFLRSRPPALSPRSHVAWSTCRCSVIGAYFRPWGVQIWGSSGLRCFGRTPRCISRSTRTSISRKTC